ncbi:hypothetical protein D3C86_2156420 [compost metagenome]
MGVAEGGRRDGHQVLMDGGTAAGPVEADGRGVLEADLLVGPDGADVEVEHPEHDLAQLEALEAVGDQ